MAETICKLLTGGRRTNQTHGFGGPTGRVGAKEGRGSVSRRPEVAGARAVGNRSRVPAILDTGTGGNPADLSRVGVSSSDAGPRGWVRPPAVVSISTNNRWQSL